MCACDRSLLVTWISRSPMTDAWRCLRYLRAGAWDATGDSGALITRFGHIYGWTTRLRHGRFSFLPAIHHQRELCQPSDRYGDRKALRRRRGIRRRTRGRRGARRLEALDRPRSLQNTREASSELLALSPARQCPRRRRPAGWVPHALAPGAPG